MKTANRRLPPLPAAALLAAVLCASAASAATLTVSVHSPAGTPLSGVGVCACHFGNGGPDAQSRLVATGDDGKATFTLADGLRYDVLAAAQGTNPGLRQQYAGKHPVVQFEPDDEAQTADISLSSAGVKNVGEIVAQVGGLTPNEVMLGEVRVTRSGAAVASGMAAVDDKGNATLRLFNVPFTPANRLTVIAFDPGAFKSIQTRVDQNLLPASPLLVYTLNFPSSVADAYGTAKAGMRFAQARPSSAGPAPVSVIPKKSPHRHQ